MADPKSSAPAAILSNADLAYRMERQFLVEQFYYAEAAALDQRRYDDWLALFTDDVHYWMPVRRTRTSNEIDREFTAPGAVAYFDDTKAMLAGRVRKLQTGYSWAEDPPSRTRHLITNVQILDERDDALNFPGLALRTRAAQLQRDRGVLSSVPMARKPAKLARWRVPSGLRP